MNKKTCSNRKKKNKNTKKIYLNKNFKIKNQYNCFKKALNNNEIECFIDTLKIIEKILSKHKIDWIPCSGSLLSLYRHKDIMIPWDDDCDITVEKDKQKLAIKVLMEEAPLYNCKCILYYDKYNSGQLYKFFFDKSKKYTKILQNQNKYLFSIKEGKQVINDSRWPFVDIFIGVRDKTKYKNFGAFSLEKNEYPLNNINIRGINFKYPTKGIRSYESFKKKGDLDYCIYNKVSHKSGIYNLCIGEKKVKCSELFIK